MNSGVFIIGSRHICGMAAREGVGTNSRSVQAKSQPRGSDGRFIKASKKRERVCREGKPNDAYIILDEFGTLGRPYEGERVFGFTAVLTDDIVAFENAGDGYTKYPDGRERKAKHRINSDADRRGVLTRAAKATVSVNVVVLEKKEDGSTEGAGVYTDIANRAVNMAIKDASPGKVIHIRADNHSSWGKDRDIRNKIQSKDSRIKSAFQVKSSKSAAIATNDYVTYAAGMKFNKRKPGLWNHFVRMSKRRNGV